MEFDDLAGLLEQGTLSPQQADAIAAIGRKVGEMSLDAGLWTITALLEHPDWAEVRRLAAAALQLIAARA